jgi:HEAT repeat protein
LQAGCRLDAVVIPLLVQHLTSQQQDTRAAAGAALADALQQHPAAISSSLQAVVDLFGDDPEEEDEQVCGR